MPTPRVALKDALKVRFSAGKWCVWQSQRTGLAKHTNILPLLGCTPHAVCCTLLSCIWHLTLEWRSWQSIRGVLDPPSPQRSCGNMLIEAVTQQLLLLLLGNCSTSRVWETIHPRPNPHTKYFPSMWFLICAFDFIWVDNRIMMPSVFCVDFPLFSYRFERYAHSQPFFMAFAAAHLLRTRFVILWFKVWFQMHTHSHDILCNAG